MNPGYLSYNFNMYIRKTYFLNYMRKAAIVCVLLSVGGMTVAQDFGNVGLLIEMYKEDASGGAIDAENYFQGFLEPAVNGIGFGVSGGWFNTAETHKVGGFDITATLTAAFVPDTDLTFRLDNANTVNVLSPADGNLPTILGSNEVPSMELKSGSAPFDALPGLGFGDDIGYNIVPTPMAQLGVGLPKGIELKIRFIPEVNQNDLAIKMFGVGVMTDIKQFIPGIKLAPFHLSGFIGYNRMNMSAGFDTNIARNGGEMIFGFNSLTFQAVVSKKLSILTVYSAIGTSNTGMNLKVNGEFDLDNDTSVYELVNPIDMDFKAFGPKVSAGFRLKLAVVTLHVDYTLQKFNALTAGVGISIR